MAALIMCPHCSRRVSADDATVGKPIRCPGCGKEFVVENLAGPHRSIGGVPIYRPERLPGSGKLTNVSTPFLPQITKHLEANVGPISWVFHEIISTDVHIDLHCIPAQPGLPASKERPLGGDYVTFATSGLSARPMKVPAQAKSRGVSEYAELMLALPKNWPGLESDGTFDQVEMKDPAKWWPFRWLKQMARLPHEYGTFFSHGVTVPNGDPDKPFAPNTKLSGWMVFMPLLSLPVRRLQIGEDIRVDFFALFALTGAEMNLKLQKGLSALTHALADKEIYTELLDASRSSAA